MYEIVNFQITCLLQISVPCLLQEFNSNYPKMTFSIFSLFDARIMPIAVYAAIKMKFWLTFAVLFIPLASHIVPSLYCRAILNYGWFSGDAPWATGQANSQ